VSFALDTSVVLRLLVGTPEPQAQLAHAAIAGASEAVGISDLVIAETYHALRHHYGVTASDAIRALHSLLSDRRIRALGGAFDVLGDMLDENRSASRAGLVDRLIAAEYREVARETITFDRDMAHLTGARTLDPNA
jgi:predicted nucleic-acid-binding protein